MATLYKFTVFDSKLLEVRSFLSFGAQVRWTFLIHYSSCASELIQSHWIFFLFPIDLYISVLGSWWTIILHYFITYLCCVHCHFVTINFLRERLMVAFDRNEMVNLSLFHFFESFVVTTCVQPFIYLMRAKHFIE